MRVPGRGTYEGGIGGQLFGAAEGLGAEGATTLRAFPVL